MIKKLTIQNFQSHKKTELDFDPGVNVVVGTSDSGKTAIIRALRWLVWNRPSGEAFRSTWGGETSVKIVSDDSIITRNKDRDNTYTLGDSLFTAFGSDIPEEIVRALNLSKINLQEQLDSPFLLTASPGEVAKHFNKIAHLDQIDKGLSNIQKQIRELEQKSKYDENHLIELKESIKEYEHLDKFEIEVEVLEEIQINLVQKINQKRNLNKLIEVLQKTNTEITTASKILKIEKPLDVTLTNVKELERLENDRQELSDLLWEIKVAQSKITKHENILQREPEVISLLEKYEERKEKQSEVDQIHNLISDLEDIKSRRNLTLERQSKYQKEFDEAMPDVCPLCGQKVEK